MSNDQGLQEVSTPLLPVKVAEPRTQEAPRWHSAAPLTPEQEVKILRGRYPEALICTWCAVLLATRRESYAKSNLTEAAHLAYVCAECRWDAQEAARAAEARRAASVVSLAAARAARAEKLAARRGIAASYSAPLADPHKQRASGEVDMTGARGGRPRRHVSRKAAARAASRAYRARQKASGAAA